jgi:hypothetical protein
LPFAVTQQLYERHYAPPTASSAAHVSPASNPLPDVNLPAPPAPPLALDATADPADIPPETDSTIAIFGKLLAQMIQKGYINEGRVWLLMRFLDKEKGEGRVSVEDLRRALTQRDSPYYCFGWKRLRQILANGDSIFWRRDKKQGTYIHYFGEARVTLHCGLKNLRGWAVSIPVQELSQPIKKIRSLFYDALHSARGDGYQKPITRRSLSKQGYGDKRTQRDYEKVRGIGREEQFVKLGTYNRLAWRQAQAEDREAAHERIGGPAFTFVDYQGRIKECPYYDRRVHKHPHQHHWHYIYILRQIGNAYRGTLPTVKRSRKWTNRKLKHLCKIMHPTGSFAVDTVDVPADSDTERMYFSTQEKADEVLTKVTRVLPTFWQDPTKSQEAISLWRTGARKS